ncbi:ABC transporter-related protein [Chloroherpeton thalassium ATCC 35110]|uniref:ABC transporter-related protein n=1 Tax=Chloroherpeton thalassium (strain ATCC 35110 / GB-78) TaxID=517418 RepID=B3QXT6_CHLT3|nr:ABC transporter ATP-binding protein [Chloroherpeton thalassium]ACF13464.1 ABC transporter-related protein [Chloroherpeton thalassium ATCC 35110]
MKKESQKSGLARLLEIAGRRKALLFLSGALVILHAILALTPYFIVFYILNALLSGENASQVIDLLAWALGAVALSFALMYASGMASHIAAFNILYELRCKIAEKLGNVPMGYVNNKSSGSLKKILADDVERIETFIAHGIPDTVKAVALPVICLIFLFVIDWRLALVSFIPLLGVIIFVPSTMGTEESKKAMEKYHNSLEDMNAGIVEFVRAMPVMKIFGQSATAFTKYSGTVYDFQEHVNKWTQISAPLWGMLMSFLNNALLPVLALGVYLYFSAGLTLSVFFLFLVLGVGYIRPIFALVSLSTQLVIIDHGVKRMDEILFDMDELDSGSDSLPQNFSLKFDNVSFAYTEDNFVLKNVSFDVPQGSLTALVGPSGSGKTTAGQLVVRFYDVNAGSISLGGVNIKSLPVEKLMENVGFVFQDNMMFYQSIFDNIRMGAKKSLAEVIAAAKIARCHDFIMQLPNQYETRFGDKGVHLSGGEQQRIQLARVILKDAPVLILDEATAFSDPENEHLIMDACRELMQNKTVIIIAHRLSTITEAEQVVVLNQGKVACKGTHIELLASCPLYHKMWNAHTRAQEFDIKKCV